VGQKRRLSERSRSSDWVTAELKANRDVVLAEVKQDGLAEVRHGRF